jgi:hypothetical protein
MSELVILCNEQNIYCDSVAYLCNGAVRKDSESYQTTSFSEVGYTTTGFNEIGYATTSFNEVDYITTGFDGVAYVELYSLYTYLFTSNAKRVVTSDGDYMILSSSKISTAVDY